MFAFNSLELQTYARACPYCNRTLFLFFVVVVVAVKVLGKALKVYIQLLNGRLDGPGSGKLFKQTFSPANDGKGTFYRQFTGSGSSENCETKTKNLSRKKRSDKKSKKKL